MSWNSERGPRIAFLGTGAQGASIAADFALAGLDVTFIDQWPDHIEADFGEGVRCPVIGLAALLANKRAAGRPQDLADVDALEKLSAALRDRKP